MKDRVLIIDFLNFVYRGLVSFNKPNNDEQDYTIVYNFFRNLRAIIEEFSPSRCLLVLEGIPSFRKELFPEYKANRITKTGSKQAATKDNVIRQAEIIIHLVTQGLPLTLVRGAKYEADDTICTLVNNLKNEEIIIVSSDSDLIQILQSFSDYDIKLFNPTKKIFVSPPNYVYLVWKCIAGDATDNIPGIASAAKAERLAQDPKELQNFLSDPEHKAGFLLNKQLIELKLVPEEELEIIQCRTDFNFIFNEFDKMKFASMIKPAYRERFVETFQGICK